MAVSSASAPGSGLFGLTKTNIFVLASLVMTWCLSSTLPRYKPIVQAGFRARMDEARQRIPVIKVEWKTPDDDDPRSAYNTSKVALLVEARPLPHLVPQVLHMMSVVPPEWRFVFVGSETSVLSVGRAYSTRYQQTIGKLDLMVLPEPWDVGSKEMVSRALTDMRFYDEFLPGVEWILKFESDSILCANSDQSLNEFLGWSWVGAPRTPDDRFAGNGGLSLRRVSAIRRVLGFQARYNDSEPEDEWFGKRLYVLPGARVAAGTGQAFSVEDVYMEKPMGYHVRDHGRQLSEDVWRDRDRRRHIFEYCPELRMIMDMKLERERCPNDDGYGTLVHPPLPPVLPAPRVPAPMMPDPTSGSAEAQMASQAGGAGEKEEKEEKEEEAKRVGEKPDVVSKAAEGERDGGTASPAGGDAPVFG